MIVENGYYWHMKGCPSAFVYTTAEGVEKFNKGEIFYGSLVPFEDGNEIKMNLLFLTPLDSGIVKAETRGQVEKVLVWLPPGFLFSDGSTSELSDELLEYLFNHFGLVKSPEELEEVKERIELLHGAK
ncbi:hypothetical protein Bp8pC_171 [Bacillus phage Bp8p-C]|uniref:Uncharacterized protein n=2 Tax=Agatevirus Bp8pC TaxID=1910937 RepID=A0A0A0PUW2_9CAUD|nr:hypothetical protein AXJ20_gp177 [Bacillus phage Bp8p-C]YP_009784471.1 hypothetical protein QLX39_gp177 [Bacillus phage Bp8p-T]AHJ87601.1 hypothetical protein Bp8pC_171 [Bacillus phage Bp8p-C]AHJ87812.1 hypothetical protein Bp8pT_171 [Bacillus phage Bp8p-T]